MKKPRQVALSLREVIAYQLSEAEAAGFEHPLRLIFMDKDDFALVLRFDAGHGGAVKGSMLAEPPGGAKNRKMPLRAPIHVTVIDAKGRMCATTIETNGELRSAELTPSDPTDLADVFDAMRDKTRDN